LATSVGVSAQQPEVVASANPKSLVVELQQSKGRSLSDRLELYSGIVMKYAGISSMRPKMSAEAGLDLYLAVNNCLSSVQSEGPAASALLPSVIQIWNQTSDSELKRNCLKAASSIAPLDPRTSSLISQALVDNDPAIILDACVCIVIGHIDSIQFAPKLHRLVLSSGKTSYLAYQALGQTNAFDAQYGDEILSELLAHIDELSLDQSAALFSHLTKNGIASDHLISQIGDILAKENRPYVRYAAICSTASITRGLENHAMQMLLDEWNEEDWDDATIKAAQNAIVNLSSANHKANNEIFERTLVHGKLTAKLAIAMAMRQLHPIVSEKVSSALLAAYRDEASSDEMNYRYLTIFADAICSIKQDNLKIAPSVLHLMHLSSDSEDEGSDFLFPSALRILCASGIPKDKKERRYIWSMACRLLAQSNAETITVGAKTFESLPEYWSESVPLLVGKLKEAEVRGGLGTADHQVNHQHGTGWDYNLGSDVYGEVIKVLKNMGAASVPALPVLEQYGRMPDGAILESVRMEARSAVTVILGKTGREVNFDTWILRPNQASSGRSAELIDRVNGNLTDVYGKEWLYGSGSGQITVFIFADIYCPCVRAYTLRIRQFCKKWNSKNVQVIYLFPSKRENLKDIQSFAKRENLPGVVAKDGMQRLAKTFNAEKTAQTIIVDKNGLIRYNGAFDDNIYKPEMVKYRWAGNVVTCLMQGVSFKVNSSLPDSCDLVY
jgi:hypothetical protein